MSREFVNPLSEKPSQFLEEALADLQETEKMPKVIVDFQAPWCKGDGKVTRVNFAGCTIMQRDAESQTIKDGLHVNPDWYDYNTSARLYVLSGMTRGRVVRSKDDQSGESTITIKGRIVESLIAYRIGDVRSIRNYEDKYGHEIDVPDYHQFPIDFFICIKKVCRDLAEFGL